MDIKDLPLTNLPPVQLWISDTNLSVTENWYLKTFFCANSSNCKLCYGCKAIDEGQHPSVMHLSPPYTLESIEPVKKKIAFLLESNERYFFVLPSAEKLLVGTANALLKIFEEPPKGYHFILQTNHQEIILPTIASRAVLFHLKSTALRVIESKFQPLIDHFLQIKPLSADGFLTLVDSLELTEQESAQALTLLLSKLKKSDTGPLDTTTVIQHLLMNGATTNSKFLWKNLFLETLSFEK